MRPRATQREDDTTIGSLRLEDGRDDGVSDTELIGAGVAERENTGRAFAEVDGRLVTADRRDGALDRLTRA